MIRDLPRLARHEFDVLVVGGGIYGLAIAYDAAQRGLSTALIDRGDLGGATSFNHLKTLHGGLRYLQTGDLGRMRRSILERRAFAQIAPRFVAPQAFALPTASSPTRHPLSMKAAFAVDAVVGWGRNDGVSPHHQLPAGQIITGAECERLFHGALPDVRSAAVWFDYVTTRSERLTLSFAKGAARWGATIANYVDAVALSDASRISHRIDVRDVLTGDTFEIRSRSVVNAAGPWAARLFLTGQERARWPLMKAMNLVTSRPSGSAALAATSAGGRALVLLPWARRWIVGTSESHDERQPDDQSAVRSEVDAFLQEVNNAFPSLRLRRDEITLVHRGVVPAGHRHGRIGLLGQSRVIDHTSEGRPRLVSVVGVKYTTARRVGEQVVDLLMTKLGRGVARCRTAETVLPDAGLHDTDPADPVDQAVRAELAQTLQDVVVRRTGLGAAGYPGDEAATAVAGRLEALLGWRPARTQQEIEALKQFYRVMT